LTGKLKRRPLQPLFTRLSTERTVTIPVHVIEGFSRATRGLRTEVGDLKTKEKLLLQSLKSTEELHEAELEEARLELDDAYQRVTVTKHCFRIGSLQESDLSVRRFTFAPSWAAFCALVDDLRPYITGRTGTGAQDISLPS
jgi:hypothetical protein